MNAIAHHDIGTVLYEPLPDWPDENQLSLRTDEQIQVVEPTSLYTYASYLPNTFGGVGGSGGFGAVIVANAHLNNDVGAYECAAGTTQPLFFGFDECDDSFDLLYGGGLIAAAASRRKHWHFAPSWIIEASEPTVPKLLAVMYFRSSTSDDSAIFADHRPLPTTDAQREERRATAALAISIEQLLPGLSDAELGSLVGVSRLSWRDWHQGLRVARPKKRRQLLRLKRILDLRAAAATPSESLTHWLETPVGANLDVTPAQLLREGRDQLVATLAARSPVPEADDLGLATPLDIGGLENARLHDLEDEAIVRAGYDADDSM
jgi:hypothetical protein